MDELLSLLLQTLAALAIGLLIGAERERSRARHPVAQKEEAGAGIRTFALISLSASLLTLLPQPLTPWAVVAGLVFTCLMALLSYARSSKGKHSDKGFTTEVALVTAYILGAMTGFGLIIEAMMMAVIVLLLLHYKAILHSFSRSLSADDLKQIIQFLVISILILPLLPNESYGPFAAFNPQRIWLMVVLVSGIGFAAYVAMKLVGERAGLGFTGILGGIISSTAVTLALSRLTRTTPAATPSSLLAIVLACGTMFPRVLAYALLFSPETAWQLALPVGVVILYVAIYALVLWHRSPGHKGDSGYQPTNPLSLKVALYFGALFGAVIFFSKMAESYLGESGLFVVAALSGTTDVDAITLSTMQMASEGLNAVLAAQVILTASAVNTVVKLGIGLATAHRSARLGLAAGLTPMVGICLVAIWLL